MNQSVLESHVNSIEKAMSNKKLKEAVTEALGALGFERWIYASENPHSSIGMPATLACGYTSGWLITYLMKRYQAIDPIVLHCRKETDPIFWDPTIGWEEADDKTKQLMDDIQKHGFGSGVAIPLHNADNVRGLLNVTSENCLQLECARYEKNITYLEIIAETLHESMCHLLGRSSNNNL